MDFLRDEGLHTVVFLQPPEASSSSLVSEEEARDLRLAQEEVRKKEVEHGGPCVHACQQKAPLPLVLLQLTLNPNVLSSPNKRMISGAVVGDGGGAV